MFVIMGVATDARAERSFAGIAIGLTVFIGAEVVGPVSGGSFNPARSIAPALVSGNLDHLWLYIIAPILGAACVALLYNLLGNVAENPVVQQSTTKEILEESKVIN
ncbi:MAG: aqpZ2 [Firmicutes bacterium]|nr:aqpZ2 [Bacillota bacterium]